MNINQVLDNIKDIKNFKSDRELADYLKVSKSAVSYWRNGAANPDSEHAMLIAETTDLDPGKVAKLMMALRAKDKRTRKYWEAASIAIVVPALTAIVREVCILCQIALSPFFHKVRVLD